MTATTIAPRSTGRALRPAPRRSAPRPTRPDLRVVRDAAVTARRTRRRWAFAAAVVVLTVLTVVVFHVMLAQSQITIDRLDRRIAAAEASYQQARFHHDQLTSPPRITEMAKRLGLEPPARPPTAVEVAPDDVTLPHIADSPMDSAERVKSGP